MRHEIFDKWLTEKRDINYVIEFLADANFDPEFYSLYEKKLPQSLTKKMVLLLHLERKAGNEFLPKLKKI